MTRLDFRAVAVVLALVGLVIAGAVRDWFACHPKRRKPEHPYGLGNVAQSMSLMLSNPVRAGSEIRVMTTHPALAVTDDQGNTYQRLTIDEWRAITSEAGPLMVTVDWATGEGNEVQVKEWR